MKKNTKIMLGILGGIILLIVLIALFSSRPHDVNSSGTFKKITDSSLTTNREKWDNVEDVPTDLALELMDFASLLADFGDYKLRKNLEDLCPPAYAEIEIFTNDYGKNRRLVYTFYESQTGNNEVGYMEVLREESPFDGEGYLRYQRDDCNLNVEIKGRTTKETINGNTTILNRQSLETV